MTDGHPSDPPLRPLVVDARPTPRRRGPPRSRGSSAGAADRTAAHPSHPSPRKWSMARRPRSACFCSFAYSFRPCICRSTRCRRDDAYVNGHVTFVAPRVAGQVSRVLVDDNIASRKGTCWSNSTRSRIRVQVAIKEAAVTAAEARPDGRPGPGPRPDRPGPQQPLQAASTRWRSDAISSPTWHRTWPSSRWRKPSLVLAEQNYTRSEELVEKGAVSRTGVRRRRRSAGSGQESREQRRADDSTDAGRASDCRSTTKTRWMCRRISIRPSRRCAKRCRNCMHSIAPSRLHTQLVEPDAEAGDR